MNTKNLKDELLRFKRVVNEAMGGAEGNLEEHFKSAVEILARAPRSSNTKINDRIYKLIHAFFDWAYQIQRSGDTRDHVDFLKEVDAIIQEL